MTEPTAPPDPGRPTAPTNPVVVFDGVCNLCNATVQFLLSHDRAGVLRFAANQSEPGQALLHAFGKQAADVSSVYLIEGDRCHDRSTAALRIARLLPWPWRLAYALIVLPRPIRDLAYALIARNRYRLFGRRESCRLATPAERARFLDLAPAPAAIGEAAHER